MFLRALHCRRPPCHSVEVHTLSGVNTRTIHNKNVVGEFSSSIFGTPYHLTKFRAP